MIANASLRDKLSRFHRKGLLIEMGGEDLSENTRPPFKTSATDAAITTAASTCPWNWLSRRVMLSEMPRPALSMERNHRRPDELSDFGEMASASGGPKSQAHNDRGNGYVARRIESCVQGEQHQQQTRLG